jgi:hypothetical protein
MTNKTRVLHVRLTEHEYASYGKCIDEVGKTFSRFTRKLIRETINDGIDLLTDEQSLLKLAIRQLVGMANNLNQITAAIHSGVAHRTVDEAYLNELRQYVYAVKKELVAVIRKTTKRWVKDNAR